MIEQLRRVVAGRTRSPTFRECRRCGTTLGEQASGCPACGSTEIAQYDL